ncbi:hypothetical protein NQ318_008448 [Aromia moschata]|uniref:Uncharacterized protein n=1 Tax=Aromia moschata TaxID=1265417 RepID=A0AAV8YB51_9CUCU|nr:hypothetical protein NQ318_008448 [Aromia moschata]
MRQQFGNPEVTRVWKCGNMLTATSKIATKLQPALGQVSRQMSVISGPPQVKISPVEKAIHGVVIAVGMMAIPAWVLVNIKNYRAHE